MTSRSMQYGLAIVAAFLIFGCGGGGGGNPGPTPVTISISPTTAQVQVGTTKQFTATVNGTGNTTVTWSVQEQNGGTVVAGLYTAPNVAGVYHVVATSVADTNKSAIATMTVTSGQPRSGTVNLTVTKMPDVTMSYVTNVTIGPVPLQIIVDRPTDGSPFGPAVITTDEGVYPAAIEAHPTRGGQGVVLAKGSLSITVTRGQTTSASVNLVSTIDHLEVAPTNPTVNVGASVQLTMTAKDQAGTVIPTSPPKITWTSGTPAVATVDAGGKVSALTAGSSRITVTDAESTKSVFTDVTVSQQLLNGHIELDGNPIRTDSDGQTLGNLCGGKAPDGRMYAFGNGTQTLLDSSAQVISRATFTTFDGVSSLIGDTAEIAFADADLHQIHIRTLDNAPVRDTNVSGYVNSTDYVTGANKHLIVASDTGIYRLNYPTWKNPSSLKQGKFRHAAGDGNTLYVSELNQADNKQHFAMYSYGGSGIADKGFIGNISNIRVVDGYNLVLVTVFNGPNGAGVYSYKRDGSLIGFLNYGFSGANAIQAFDRDWSSPNRLYAAFGTAALQPFKIVSP